MASATAFKLSAPNELPRSNKGFAEVTTRTWTIPRIAEIAVGLEINAYACAALD